MQCHCIGFTGQKSNARNDMHSVLQNQTHQRTCSGDLYCCWPTQSNWSLLMSMLTCQSHLEEHDKGVAS